MNNHGDTAEVTTKDAKSAKDSKDLAWERLQISEYHIRVREIMRSYGVGDGDVDLILWNTWSDGYSVGVLSEFKRSMDADPERPPILGVLFIAILLTCALSLLCMIAKELFL